MAELVAAAAVAVKVDTARADTAKVATSSTHRRKATAKATTEHRRKPKRNRRFSRQKYSSSQLQSQIDQLVDALCQRIRLHDRMASKALPLNDVHRSHPTERWEE